MNHGDLVGVGLSNLRDRRDDAARWREIGVLPSEEAAFEEKDLVIRLESRPLISAQPAGGQRADRPVRVGGHASPAHEADEALDS